MEVAREQLETPPMPHASVSPRLSLGRVLVQALVISLVPLAAAFAQPNPHVRVVREGVEIRSTQRAKTDVLMTASLGTLLEVIYIEGDRYTHRDTNWYWVLLPRDEWGSRPAGWIRGDVVEYVPPPEPASQAPALGTNVTGVQEPQQASNVPVEMPARVEAALPDPALEMEVAADQPVIPELVLTFQFGKSDLSDEAKGTLASAVAMLKANAQGRSVALEGHADSTGSEAFNERLGLARAEVVRQYLADQLQVPADTIGVVSYGENSPAAPNTTPEGRAQNRRVVIKVGA
jgi:outer membrane protein OmpA-like peptidoglycan-associated protein